MLNGTGTRKDTLNILCALALTFGAFFSLGVKPFFVASAQVERNPDSMRYEFVPDHIIYRTLFHTIFLLNKQADEAERARRVDEAQAFRRAFKQDAGLGYEQATILNGIAAECEQAVRAVDARARKIIEARRAYYPDGKLRAGQQPLPPSPELAALQQERDALILRYRDRLRAAFGQGEWERFVQLVPARVAAGIRTNRALPQSAFVKASLRATNTMAQTQAESVITGSTLISYDAYTNLVTAVSTTELDFSAQDWYRGRVSSSIRDVNGNTLASGSAYDTDRDGTVSVTVQTAGQDQMTYAARGVYGARAEIQDYNLGSGWYIDHWNYQDVIRGPEGGTVYYIYMPFYGRGPRRTTRLRNLLLGETSPATVQARPRVDSGTPTFTNNPITVATGSTDVNTNIEASTVGLQSGDYAVVEIGRVSGDGQVTYAGGQVREVPLALGDRTTATFTIQSVSAAGTHTFRMRIADIRRPNGQGGFTSILNQVTVNTNGNTANLTVRD